VIKVETKIYIRQRNSSLFSGSDSATKSAQGIYLIDRCYLPVLMPAYQLQGNQLTH